MKHPLLDKTMMDLSSYESNLNISIFGGLVIVTILSGLVLSSSYASADDVVDEINITVPMSCTMSGTGMDTHNANINNGTYTPNIGTTTMHVFCNDNEGFAIYAAGYTGDEIGGESSNKLVGTSASGNAVIESGLATSAGNPDTSNWAMKLTITQDSGDTTSPNNFTIDSAPNISGGADASFGQYHVVPNEYTKVAHKNSTTDMTANAGGVKLTTTYAAYISKTQPADTYTGQVIYTLVHPSSASAPLVCNPNGTTISTIVCMQDINSTNKSSILSSMILEQQYTLVDKRDEKSYTIAKLADGNIWMTQNLDLDLDSTKTYTSADTDLPNGATWTPAASTHRNDEWQDEYQILESFDPGNLYWNDWYDDRISNENEEYTYYESCTYNPSTDEYENCDESLKPNPNNQWSIYYATCMPNWDTCDASLNPQGLKTTGSSHYHVGNYYNFIAATAQNSMPVDYPNNSMPIEQSICPAGWTLPRIGTGEDTFYSLWDQYGFANNLINGNYKIWESPLYIITPIQDVFGGQYGNYWSSVLSEYEGADGPRSANPSLNSSSNNSSPSGWGERNLEGTIRCIARPVTTTIQE